MTTMPTIDSAALGRLRRIGGDDLVRKMIDTYLTNGADRIHALKDGAAMGDAERVERAAHTLKSSAGNMGAVRLQQAAEELEQAAASGAIDTELVDRVIREYDASAAALARPKDE